MSNVPSRTARKGACAAAWSGARLETDIALTVVTTDTNSARQPKSDVSDFGHSNTWPNSGKPEFDCESEDPVS